VPDAFAAALHRRRPAALLLALAGVVLGLAGFFTAPATDFVGGFGLVGDRLASGGVALNARSPFPSEPEPANQMRREGAMLQGGFFLKGRQTAVRVNPKTNKPIRFLMHVKAGDTVQVVSGKDKGKVTQVIKTFPKWNKVLCLGVNFNIKHVRPQREDEVGSRVQVEAPMHSSRVMHYDTEQGVAGNLGIRIEKLDNGAIVKMRYNKATGARIPLVEPPEWVPVLDRE